MSKRPLGGGGGGGTAAEPIVSPPTNPNLH
jgi:hypothetical protein